VTGNSCRPMGAHTFEPRFEYRAQEVAFRVHTSTLGHPKEGLWKYIIQYWLFQTANNRSASPLQVKHHNLIPSLRQPWSRGI
jgi:hypothetical protein